MLPPVPWGRAEVRYRLPILFISFLWALGITACGSPSPRLPEDTTQSMPPRGSSGPASLRGEGTRDGAGARLDPWTVVPRERVGRITERTNRDDLSTLLGEENVFDEWIYLAEGFCVPGTLVFPETPDELEITWKSAQRAAPATIRFRRSGGRWATDDGVRVGTTLAQLESIKGEPLIFGGFGWDYGGGAAWRGLSLRLRPDDDSYRRHANDPQFPEILGERSVRSDHPIIREMTVRVVSIELAWGFPEDEVECPGPVR